MGETKPKGQPTLLGKVVKRFSLSSWVYAIKTLDAIANSRGENGVYIVKSESGWVFSSRKKVSVSSSGMNYTGEYTGIPADYVAGDVTRVSPDNAFATTNDTPGPTLPGVYVANSTPAEGEHPIHPMQEGGETGSWDWLSTWPSIETRCVSGTAKDYAADSQPLADHVDVSPSSGFGETIVDGTKTIYPIDP